MEGWGKEVILDLGNCNPDTIRSKEKLAQFIIELCVLIDMKRFGEPIIEHFGEEDKVAGYSIVQLIMTSCITGHFANATNSAYINVFSCKDYDAEVVKEFAMNFFEASTVNVTVLQRNI